MCCPDHQTISAFADRELEAAQAAEVKRHVGKCASCRQSVEEMQWLAYCGRGALGAIHVGETTTSNIVSTRPLWPKWARPLSLAAAAAVVLALSIWTWIASSHFSRHQAPSASHQVASVTATHPGLHGYSKESGDTAFEQWAAPYRELRIPLVSIEVAESYNPDPILPILPDDIGMNR
jgi:anti-sigma factor RsiW